MINFKKVMTLVIPIVAMRITKLSERVKQTLVMLILTETLARMQFHKTSIRIEKNWKGRQFGLRKVSTRCLFSKTSRKTKGRR
jgi:hypothetical protein